MFEYAKRLVPKKLSLIKPPPDAAPVLSPHDEKYFETALSDSSEPVVVLEGRSGDTTPSVTASTPVIEKKEEETVTPAVAVAVDDNKAVEEKKDDKATKKDDDDWKDTLTTKWEGLRRTVSSAASSRRTKSHEKSRSKSQDKHKSKSKSPLISPTTEAAAAVPIPATPQTQEEKEAQELATALENLNLAAVNGRTFSLSPSTSEVLSKFTQVLKDLSNGVPTAYDDLTSLLDNSSKTLEETFTNLPGFLQKLVKTLPEKMSKNLSPEILRAAAAATPGVAAESLTMPGLKEMVTKPGLLMGLLKSVVNVLKTRFPALLGANMALSMGLFVVLLVLWYCHKRGKEVRLEREALERGEVVDPKIDAERMETLAEGHIPAGSAGTVEGKGKGKVE